MAAEFAPVTPSVLRWARESIGASVEEAAERAKVDAGRLRLWELGQGEPSLPMLRRLAAYYQRPLAVFFLPTPPTDFMTLRDFRRLPRTSDHTWTRALHKVFRRAVDQQEILVELLEDADERADVRLPTLALAMDTERAAETARGALGVSLINQIGWRDLDDAFRSWAEAIESLGVLVLRTSDVELDEMRGFSISTGDVPVVTVNALDSPRGQVFTLLHEFIHLTLRQNGLCDTFEPETGEARRVEVFCNAVAAAVLMPRGAFLAEELVAPVGERVWDDDALGYLAGRYSVSREAVLRRLVTFGRASSDHYLAKREEYLRAYDEVRAQERERRREKPGGPPPHRMAIRDRGKPYVRVVLDAYHREAITPSTLSTALGLKLKHLPALEREVRG